MSLLIYMKAWICESTEKPWKITGFKIFLVDFKHQIRHFFLKFLITQFKIVAHTLVVKMLKFRLMISPIITAKAMSLLFLHILKIPV